MIARLQTLALLSMIALLAACASPVPKVDISADKLSAVKTIAVVRPPEPRFYTVLTVGHPGLAFGLVGGVVAAMDQSSKQDRLSDAFSKQGVSFTTNLADRIAARLTRSGFDARVEDAPWEESEGKYKLSFEKINSTADAVLVVLPTTIGFIATGPTADYLPTITAVTTLIGKDRKESLYRGFHASGWAPKADGWKISPPKTTFSNFDALLADTKASAAALNEAGGAIAETVSSDLRR